MKIMTTCSKKSKFGRANNSDELWQKASHEILFLFALFIQINSHFIAISCDSCRYHFYLTTDTYIKVIYWMQYATNVSNLTF